MKVCYKKLFQLLIEKNIKKGDLAEMAGISSSSITKMQHDKPVKMEVIIKICEALHVNFTEIMELRNDDDSIVIWKQNP